MALIRVAVRAGLVLVDERTPDAAREAFADLGDAVMEALMDSPGIEDPFVFGDAGDPPMLMVEVVVDADSPPQALAVAAPLVEAAFEKVGLQTSSAAANVLTPA